MIVPITYDFDENPYDRFELRAGFITPFKDIYEDMTKLDQYGNVDPYKAYVAQQKLLKIQELQLETKLKEKYDAYQAKRDHLTNANQKVQRG